MSKEFDKGSDAGRQDGRYKGYRDALKAAGVKLEENPGIAGNANRARVNKTAQQTEKIPPPPPSIERVLLRPDGMRGI